MLQLLLVVESAEWRVTNGKRIVIAKCKRDSEDRGMKRYSLLNPREFGLVYVWG